MSEVTRFDLKPGGDGFLDYAEMVSCKGGDYVRFKDYEAAYRQGLEDAAKVAESAATPLFRDEWTSGQVAAAISACGSVARAIRALATKEQSNE